MLIVTSLLIAINVSERDYSPLVKILNPDILREKNALGRIRVLKRVWVGLGSGYSSMPDQGTSLQMSRPREKFLAVRKLNIQQWGP